MKLTLKQLRAGKRYSQKDLADKIGVGLNTIISYENDLEHWNKIQYQTLVKIAELFSVNIEDIDMDRI